MLATAAVRAALAVLADDGSHVVSRGLDLADVVQVDVGEEKMEARRA